MTIQNAAVRQTDLPETRVGSWGQLVWHQLTRNRGAVAGGTIFALLALAAVLAPLVAPHDPIEIAAGAAMEAPSLAHPMGTDPMGRDIFSRVIFGGRISLRLGLISVSIAAVTGGLIGLVSGYYGGLIDNVIMRLIDMLLAFPSILLALIILYSIGPGLNNAMIAVGISSIPQYARVIRGSTLSAKEETYVDAACAIGCRNLRIMVRHILPNVVGPLVVLATLSLASAVMSIAGLSFIGLGAEPPNPEWGVMLSTGRDYLRNAWWMSVFPGLAISVTVLAVNLLGDGLRDALDPRMKG